MTQAEGELSRMAQLSVDLEMSCWMLASLSAKLSMLRSDLGQTFRMLRRETLTKVMDGLSLDHLL